MKRTSSYELNNINKEKRVKFNLHKNHSADQNYDEEEEYFDELVQESLEKRKKNKLKLEGYDDDDDDDDNDNEEDEVDDDDEDSDKKSNHNRLDPEAEEDFNEVESENEGEIPIEPFNMKREKEEGRFEADGFYVENKDEDSMHDQWLVGITKNDIKKAAIAKRHTDKLSNQNQNPKHSNLTKTELLLLLIRDGLLKPGETLSDAIKRDKNNIDKLTEIADNLLLNHGYYNIYSDTYEDIEYDLIERGLLGRRKPVMYQYKWIGQEDIHGPFSAEQIKQWQTLGYFNSSPILIRSVQQRTNDDKVVFGEFVDFQGL